MLNLMTENELRSHILTEIPFLAKALNEYDHFLATTLLRDYAYRHHVWSNDGLNLKLFCGIQCDLMQLAVPQIQFLFACREIGVLCGGVAIYLAKLFQLFGYDASIFNYGIPEASTHVTTVVALPTANDYELVIQDATFNFTYHVQDTGERDLLRVVQRIMDGKSETIGIIKGKIMERMIHFGNNNDVMKEALQYYKENNVLLEDPVPCSSLLTNTMITLARGDLDFHTSYLRRRQIQVLKALSEKLNVTQDRCNVLELMLFPLELPSFRATTLQSKINGIKAMLNSFRKPRKCVPAFVLKEYGVFSVPVDPPSTKSEEWVGGWHGFYYLRKSFSDKAIKKHNSLFDENPYDAMVLEAFSLLAILETYGGRHVNFIEIGSGRAPWCMAVAGAVRHKLVLKSPASYFVLAVEAEPIHFQWSKKHLSFQNINGTAIYGAIGRRVGSCLFAAHTDPAAHMGQHVSPDGNIEVPVYTIDALRKAHGFNRIHIIHMDIQGSEVEAIEGAKESISKGLIDYFIIGTHDENKEKEIKDRLCRTHDLIVELPRGARLSFPGLSRVVCAYDDGVHVYRKRM